MSKASVNKSTRGPGGLLLGLNGDGNYSDPTSDQTYRLNGECMAHHSYSDHLSGVWRNLVIKNAKLGSSDITMKASFYLPTSDNSNRIRSTQWLGFGDRASAENQWINSPSLMWSHRVSNPTDSEENGDHASNQSSFITDGRTEQIYPPINTGDITRSYQRYWSTVAPKGKLLMHDLEGSLSVFPWKGWMSLERVSWIQLTIMRAMQKDILNF